MITSWDIYCRDCDESMGLDTFLLPKQLSGLCGQASAFAKGMSMPEGFDVHDVRFDGYQLHGFKWRWLVKHGEHALIPRDEYGRLLGECSRPVDCESCGHSTGRCTLPYGHEGSHYEPRKP